MYEKIIPTTIMAALGAATLGSATFGFAETQPYHVRTTYGNDHALLDRISQVSGSSIQVTYQKRSNQLQRIKEIFGFTDATLAEIIGVSRKTLHNWEQQGIKKEKDRQRIFELAVIAKDWEYNQLPIAIETLSQTVLHGLSALDMLKAEKLDREKIIFAGQRLAHQALQPETGLF